MNKEEITHCPTCGKEAHLCHCPTIDRGSFARYVPSKEAEVDRPGTCSYCGKKADGAMLGMGNFMAHADCAIQKLNELLDYDYDGGDEPIKIVGYLSKSLIAPKETIT